MKGMISHHTLSDDVQDIVGQEPNGVVRWGMTWLLIAMILFFVMACFVRYPQVVQAKIVITTESNSAPIVARTEGNLILVSKDGAEVDKDSLVAFIATDVSPKVVLALEREVRSHRDYTDDEFIDASLGELTSMYSVFRTDVLELRIFRALNPNAIRIAQMRTELIGHRSMQTVLQRKFALLSQEVSLGQQQFRMDSTLYVTGVVSQSEYHEDLLRWLKQQRSYLDDEALLLSNKLRITELSRLIGQACDEQRDELTKLEVRVENSRNELLSSIGRWKERHLFVTPVSGKLSYIGKKESDMYVRSGEPILSILPSTFHLVGHAEVPVYNSGKVMVGQTVAIKLDNFPFEEYGMVNGVVKTVSVIPNEDSYVVTIQLPGHLDTTLHRRLEFKQQLSGVATIVVDDLLLIERVFYGIRRLLIPRA